MSVADNKDILRLIELAKSEDFGQGDISSSLLDDPQQHATFHLIAKQRGVFAGREVAAAVFAAYGTSVDMEWTASGVDGRRIDSVPAQLATVCGPLGTVLSAERVLLNFLQRLCGVATLTRAFVDAVAGTDATIYDTRKTTPGWRMIEKYAVRCGGGSNHRMGLYDAVLIKDNHLAGIGTTRLAHAVFEMLGRLSKRNVNPTFVEIEADGIEQVKQLLKVVGIDAILLDNFSLDQLREAVIIRDNLGLRGKVVLEASGGITLQTVRAVAETGVERISVGALTHSAVALDLSLDRV
jgi:nicotinate-nucleotide pyrophosphorylase (carboxylating)